MLAGRGGTLAGRGIRDDGGGAPEGRGNFEDAGDGDVNDVAAAALGPLSCPFAGGTLGDDGVASRTSGFLALSDVVDFDDGGMTACMLGIVAGVFKPGGDAVVPPVAIGGRTAAMLIEDVVRGFASGDAALCAGLAGGVELFFSALELPTAVAVCRGATFPVGFAGGTETSSDGPTELGRSSSSVNDAAVRMSIR